MPQKPFQKLKRLFLSDRLVGMQVQKQTQALPPRADGDSADRRDMPVRARPLMKHRRAPGGRPGATYPRAHQKAAFVRENEVRLEPGRFF